MRNLDKYDVIVCDIDDTLIHGFWTDLMRVTWDRFQCNPLSDLLMWLQAKFKIYKVNQKVRHILLNSRAKIVFLTARKRCTATVKLLLDIMGMKKGFELCEMQTSNPAVDKGNYVVRAILANNLDCLVIDDNDAVRKQMDIMEVDTIDPRLLIEELIG